MTKEELINRINDIEWEDFEAKEAKAMLYHIEGKKVLTFHVPSSPHKPIYYNNPQNTFIRFGSGDQRATNGEITAMFHNQSFGIKSEEILPKTELVTELTTEKAA